MTIEQIATFSSPVEGKFGLPRQAGLAPSLKGSVRLIGGFARPEALRGLEGFDYIWLLWRFNLNRESRESSLTVRPPRLGGNERVGVFASRSPYRPNPIGLSCVRVESIDFEHCIINVLGADLADGTPIYDIKPYVAYADSHPEARCGFVDSNDWKELEVIIPDFLPFSEAEREELLSILAQDPRPQYQNDPEKTYGMVFSGRNVRFKVEGRILTVLDEQK